MSLPIPPSLATARPRRRVGRQPSVMRGSGAAASAAALDGLQAGVWEWHVPSGRTWIDESCARMLGRTLAELGPMHMADWVALVQPDQAAALQAALQALAAGETARVDVVSRFPHARNGWIWLRVCCRATERDAAGRARRVCGALLDVTAEHLAAHDLKQAHAQLQGLFDLSPVGMALSRLADGCFVKFNDALVELLGHGRERLGALRHRDLFAPDRRALARANHSELLAHGHFGPVETELMHASGRRVPVLLASMLVTLADGRQNVWSLVQDLSPIKQLEQRLRNEARTDRLTGLPNRALLLEQLEHCVARAAADPEQRFALLFLDFDRFKLVNDTLGHDAGDQLLRLIADRLRCALRSTDARAEGGSLVARLGGDEFVVLLGDARGLAAATHVASRLLEVLSAPYFVENKELHSSASIGIVLGDAHSGSAAAVLRNADMAMYDAKRSGRGCYALFEPGMLARVSRAVQLESALHHAVSLRQLSLVYQPIFDLHSGALSSVEALVRWQHPEFGAVSPGEFIPIAEESGLIVPIGEWVLREACRQWRRWQDEAPSLSPAIMSVNLSRVQMALGTRLLKLVGQVLQEHAMPAQGLQLEVTEREVMRDPAAARTLMHGLRGLGVKLAMDDFGTGASSLGCLRDYPFDVIKIDKSFIDGIGEGPAMLAVLQGTVMVIENLGMQSVAEGVEDAMQLGVLQSLGCRYGQGYHFSRPVHPDQLLLSLARAQRAD